MRALIDLENLSNLEFSEADFDIFQNRDFYLLPRIRWPTILLPSMLPLLSIFMHLLCFFLKRKLSQPYREKSKRFIGPMWHIWHVHICTWVLMSVLRLKTRYYETDVTLTDDDTNSTVTDDANPNCNQRKRHPHVIKFVTCGQLCVNLLRPNNRMDWC